MANTKSAEKRARQAAQRQRRNRAQMARMRTAVKKVRGAVAARDEQRAADLLGNTLSLVDSTAQKKVIHRNTAARVKSRLTRAVKGLSPK
jgi:small subunit ribosomal protein S20